MNKIVLLFFFSFAPFCDIFAQFPPVMSCGMPPADLPQLRYTLDVIAKKAINRSNSITYVPVKAHIVRRDNAQGGLTTAELNIVLTYLNVNFYASNIQFFLCAPPFFIDNTDLFDLNEYNDKLDGNDVENDVVNATVEAPNAVNLFFLNSIVRKNGTSVEGYAYYPSPAPRTNRIFVTSSDAIATPYGTLSHEFGHYFGLLHTHEGTEEGKSSLFAENVARKGNYANCETSGDLICDTEADPRFSNRSFDHKNCQYTGQATDKYNIYYTPPVENIMSYYPARCRSRFTPGQIVRIQQGLATRQSNTLYTLDAPPTNVLPPSNLSARYDEKNTTISLSWRDNSNNETGFFIERSIDDGATFQPVLKAATNLNTTAFVDTDVKIGIAYRYRIRPSNTNIFSENIAITTVSMMEGKLYASQQDDRSVVLNWSVKTFDTRFMYLIERVQEIKYVELLFSFSSLENRDNQTVIDRKPKFGNNQYRLVSVDERGKREILDQITLFFKENNSLKLFPNPARTTSTLIYQAKNEATATIEIYDLQQRLLFAQAHQAISGMNVLTLNVQSLLEGLYILKINVADTQHAMFFVVED